MIILLTLIIGFGFSFNALFAADRDSAPQFAFIGESLYTTYMMALFGDNDPSVYQYSSSPMIMTTLVMLLQVFILIVMMNALIGAMTQNKGIEALVAAYGLLKKTKKNLKLILKDQSNLYNIKANYIFNKVNFTICTFMFM